MTDLLEGLKDITNIMSRMAKIKEISKDMPQDKKGKLIEILDFSNSLQFAMQHPNFMRVVSMCVTCGCKDCVSLYRSIGDLVENERILSDFFLKDPLLVLEGLDGMYTKLYDLKNLAMTINGKIIDKIKKSGIRTPDELETLMDNAHRSIYGVERGAKGKN